uniref:Uncharacterized protein n=1 Tax=Fagus sylvatica TaxID=28930 RepID=A0A2N9J2E6_FAGSY
MNLGGLRSRNISQHYPPKKFTLKVFLRINTDKGIGAPLAGPKPVPILISMFAFAGLPIFSSTDCSPGSGAHGSTTFQNEEAWLVVQLLI